MTDNNRYIVMRQYGPHGWNRDYLSAIGTAEDFGTLCRGYSDWVFTDLSAAKSAARKARRVCMNWNHAKQRPRRARLDFFVIQA
jgi:beta-glucosidase/6-phospho-beta-glucosidase/beta-galactosidase